MKNIILVGLGPHARRIYYPFLEKHQSKFHIHIPLIIELRDQQNAVEEFITERTIKPETILYLDPVERLNMAIPNKARHALNHVIKNYNNIHMIIATEPKAHMQYAEYALEHNIDLLMDKPISAPQGLVNNEYASTNILKDYTRLESKLRHSKSRFIVQCQRRYHAGYTFIWDYLNNFVQEWAIPITYIDIYHADGMWNMPNELHYRENHPYKYGYGKLLHSGYHFVDLYTWYNKINHQLLNKRPVKTEILARKYTPTDHIYSINNSDYQKLLGFNFEESTLSDLNGYGELDVYALLQSTSETGEVVNTANITLQQNSFSRRAWAELPKDTYKGNGRVRHERLSVQVGPLLNIQVHSYQSHEILKDDIDTSGVGNEDHFDIYIFKNSQLVGGTTLEKVSLGEDMKSKQDSEYMGHNEKAREQCLLDWLNGAMNNSDFISHKETNIILSSLYAAIANGKPQYVTHLHES